ncbi:MAG TPA: flavodoxin family protein, partial [Treponemataceae bacterium]|nr:flavodoxin family protein [Treponemataceae bacterium]
MNILVLNGSPRGAQSNTLKITNAFLEGLESQTKHEIHRVEVSAKKIGHCLGCFACWKDTPGTCVIKDDMKEILSLIIKADLVIWSFPLYYFSMPSKLKALMDRMLPLNLPFIEKDPEGGATHPSRYDLSH